MKQVFPFNMIYAGKKEYEKDNKKNYMYSLIQKDDENKWANSTTYFTDKDIDCSKLGFMQPCLASLEIEPGSKFNKLIDIKPVIK